MRLSTKIRNVILTLAVLLAPGLVANHANAQSHELIAPSAVRTSEVAGTIAARDLGDSRLTDHFFVFTGTPGDLLITVESRNLNGDIDVFTLTGMRPLLKFTVYEGSSPLTTKSIYLRKREDLILRVEARTPNDDEGTYRVRFGGSFEPISGGPDVGTLTAESPESPTSGAATEAKSGKRGSRVSSVGARIYEPQVEVAVAPTTEPAATEKPAKESPTPAAKSRTGTGRRSTRTRPRPTTGEKAATEKPATEGETKVATTTSSGEPAPRPTTGRRRPGRRTPTPPPVEKTAQEELETGPRLLIETSDGTLINRFMTTVRRVTVENGQVVVVGKDGKVERFQLAQIVKMSVGP